MPRQIRIDFEGPFLDVNPDTIFKWITWMRMPAHTVGKLCNDRWDAIRAAPSRTQERSSTTSAAAGAREKSPSSICFFYRS
jgi:hypothetical protein